MLDNVKLLDIFIIVKNSNLVFVIIEGERLKDFRLSLFNNVNFINDYFISFPLERQDQKDFSKERKSWFCY
jgi:hypothetical protein